MFLFAMIYQWQKETAKLQLRASMLEKKLEKEVGMDVGKSGFASRTKHTAKVTNTDLLHS